TGVQTCALPIWRRDHFHHAAREPRRERPREKHVHADDDHQHGPAPCEELGIVYVDRDELFSVTPSEHTSPGEQKPTYVFFVALIPRRTPSGRSSRLRPATNAARTVTAALRT